MIIKFLVVSGLLWLAYYIGREIGRAEPVRLELEKLRELDNLEKPLNKS